MAMGVSVLTPEYPAGGGWYQEQAGIRSRLVQCIVHLQATLLVVRCGIPIKGLGQCHLPERDMLYHCPYLVFSISLPCRPSPAMDYGDGQGGLW